MDDDARTPLGVCALRHLRRMGDPTKLSSYGRQKATDRESLRWEEQIADVERRCNGAFSAIHIADREADIFDVLSVLRKHAARFVIRGHHNRLLSGHEEELRMHDHLATLVPIASKTVHISVRHEGDRPAAQRRKHPPRKARTVTLSVASCPVTIKRPVAAHALADTIDVNIVRVWESAPEQGEPPVEWLLYTSERVDTAEQMFDVVDKYRCRWVVEELFKALKTGCALEKRQLESFHALANALAMFVPIAWKMLLPRSLTRIETTAPASTLLTPIQLQLLALRFELARPIATATDAAFLVAKLGGHLRRNGPPGWQTLAHGFESLMLMQAGWYAAIRATGNSVPKGTSEPINHEARGPGSGRSLESVLRHRASEAAVTGPSVQLRLPAPAWRSGSSEPLARTVEQFPSN